MEIISLQPGTKLAELVKLVSRKRKAFVKHQNAVVLDNTYWDEGSRADYYLVHISSKRVVPLERQAPPQFGGARAAATQVIEPGYVVIEAGVFAGKPATPSVYFRTDQEDLF